MGVRPLEYFSLCAPVRPSTARSNQKLLCPLPPNRAAIVGADNVTGEGGAILVTGMAARDRCGDLKGNWRFLEGCESASCCASI
eukprot:SAG22_NODE_6226_length_883_cov_1.419643_2_plen_84_part_00